MNGKVTGVPKWLMKRGPAATLAFTERVNQGEAESESARPHIADLRRLVPQHIWIVTVAGAMLLVVGVLLAIAAGVVAIVAATEPVVISPVALFVSALVCYAIGFPMMLAFARNVGRAKGKAGAGSR